MTCDCNEQRKKKTKIAIKKSALVIIMVVGWLLGAATIILSFLSLQNTPLLGFFGLVAGIYVIASYTEIALRNELREELKNGNKLR